MFATDRATRAFHASRVSHLAFSPRLKGLNSPRFLARGHFCSWGAVLNVGMLPAVGREVDTIPTISPRTARVLLQLACLLSYLGSRPLLMHAFQARALETDDLMHEIIIGPEHAPHQPHKVPPDAMRTPGPRPSAPGRGGRPACARARAHEPHCCRSPPRRERARNPPPRARSQPMLTRAPLESLDWCGPHPCS